MANIPDDAVGVSVGVLIYSLICWFLCTILVGLLITFGEKLSYVTIHSSFTSLSTLASIIQQIHFAIRWRAIKEAQFNKAIRAMTLPGLTFVGGAHPVDMTLFFIQFWCYNTMALNIFFWSVDLFTSSWGFRTPWLGDWITRIGPISKVFSVVFPALVIGLMNAPTVLESGVATFIISNGMIFLSLTSGSILLILILYKYMKTRRLATGGSRRGGWWASRDSKSQQSRDIGSNYTPGTANLSTRSSIYDRALVTRFSIGFVILAFFLAAIIVFSYISSTTNTSIATAGRPDFSTKSAVVDILLFIPGVTASLVTFLVFGTAKSWRQYRDLLTGGCGIRNKLIQRNFQRHREDEEHHSSAQEIGTEGAIALSALPRLQTTPSLQERLRDEEAMKRVRMFSRELDVDRRQSGHTPTSSGDASMYRPDTGSTLVNYAQKPAVTPQRDSGLSYHVRAESPTLVRVDAKMQFHRPRPSLSTGLSGDSVGSGYGVLGVGLGQEEGGLSEPKTDVRGDTTRSPLTMNTPKMGRMAPVIDMDKVRSDSRDPYWPENR